MSYALDNEIFVGSVDYPLYRFDNASIVLNSISAVFAVDVIGNELSVDTLSFTVRNDPLDPSIYAPAGRDGYETQPGPLYSLSEAVGRDYMTELPFGTPVFWYCGGALMKKCYLKAVVRTAKFAWRIDTISGVGLLDNSYHAGGVYSGTSFADLAADVIGDTFAFTVSPRIADAPVFGWLPYDTRRANLHRLMFALGAAMLRGDEETDYEITLLEAPAVPPEIPDGRIAIGGSVDYQLPATGVEVTEHSFAASPDDEAEQLYDTEGRTVSGQLVVFDAPHHDLTVSGTLAIVESGVNFATVSGNGTLSGKTYKHNQSVVSLGTGADSPALVKRVTDNCLISAVNSISVARRVLAYFSSAKTVGGTIVLDGETCGRPYAFNDAFGDPTVGFLQQMTLGVSSVKKANVSFVEDYDPTGQGNSYSHMVILTGSGSWTIPAASCKAILIQGGHGGYPGTDGDTGSGLYAPFGTGAGGRGGAAGEGGKILSVELTGLTVGATLAYKCGAGGQPGKAGGETTLGSYSSVFGEAMLGGVYNLFNGVRYGVPGTPGIAGGSAGTPAINYHGTVYLAGANASYITTDMPGYLLGGGTGGGPAAGANGEDGQQGYYSPVYPVVYSGGRGGDGADAVAGDDASVYGCGGDGGNGGGGGGNGGWPTFANAYTRQGREGAAGHGSVGGRGANGCIIVYY